MNLDNDIESLLEGEFSEDIYFIDPLLSEVKTYLKDGQEKTYKGIFDKTYKMIEAETGLEVLSNYSRLTMFEVILPEGLKDNYQDWKVVIRNKRYNIMDLQSDGLNMIMLELKLA